jgi:ribosomal protein L11
MAATAQKDDAKTEQENVYRDFKDAVNMSASVLEKWLKTDESREVGYKGEDGDAKQSVGHQSGERIVEILHTKKDDLTDDDYAHMQKVVGYVRRHAAQRPKGEAAETRWAYSLKNWGHDPTKEK